MRILFISDNFPPEGNAPASRTYEHARHWVEQGHEVTVVTCAPNFPEGKLFPGFKNHWYNVSDMDGIRVVRVKTYITANEGFIKRILDYISFMFSSLVAGCFQEKSDIIIATSPQFFTACSGWALSKIKRKPFVFELRDIWPASITAVGAMKDGLVIKALEKLELFLYAQADLIVSVTHSFKKELVFRGVDESKIEVILNGVDLSHYSSFEKKDPNFVEKYGLEGKFVAGYIGTHGMAHDLERLIHVAENMSEYTDIHFLFVGGGAVRERIECLVVDKELTNVTFVDRQPKSEMPTVWSACDIALVPLADREIFSTVIPSKIFECMGMGIPTLLSVPEGEATTIVRTTNSGLVSECGNSESISTGILKLYRDPEFYSRLKNSSLASAPMYDRKVLAEEMLDILRQKVKLT